MGRKPIGRKAMTNAQRQKRYRQNKRRQEREVRRIERQLGALPVSDTLAEAIAIKRALEAMIAKAAHGHREQARRLDRLVDLPTAPAEPRPAAAVPVSRDTAPPPVGRSPEQLRAIAQRALAGAAPAEPRREVSPTSGRRTISSLADLERMEGGSSRPPAEPVPPRPGSDGRAAAGIKRRKPRGFWNEGKEP